MFSQLSRLPPRKGDPDMAYRTILFAVEDGIALITLNRPEAMNALNSALWADLAHALAACDTDDKVRAIIITGSDKAFAAGADVTEMADKTFTDLFAGGPTFQNNQLRASSDPGLGLTVNDDYAAKCRV